MSENQTQSKTQRPSSKTRPKSGKKKEAEANKLTLKGKVALITGASSGIGAGTAVHFAKLGYSLVLTGRNEENLKTTKQECVAAGLTEDQIALAVADLSTDNGPEMILKCLQASFGRLDVLVNNAALVMPGTISQLPIEALDQMFNTNVRAMVTLTKRCLPLLIQSKGNVVNVSSIAASHAFHFTGFYAMTKSAVEQFTRCLALEMGGQGVRVNAVSPGPVNTPQVAAFGEDMLKMMADVSPLGKPMGRVAKIEEIAKAIAFLASDEASFTTGEVLKVDGGTADLSAYMQVMQIAFESMAKVENMKE